MITVGIKEVKNRLSHYLTRVKTGEQVLITHRGKPIARIIKEEGGKKSIQAALGPLIQQGMIALPRRGIKREGLSPVKAPGKLISEMAIEDRR